MLLSPRLGVLLTAAVIGMAGLTVAAGHLAGPLGGPPEAASPGAPAGPAGATASGATASGAAIAGEPAALSTGVLELAAPRHSEDPASATGLVAGSVSNPPAQAEGESQAEPRAAEQVAAISDDAGQGAAGEVEAADTSDTPDAAVANPAAVDAADPGAPATPPPAVTHRRVVRVPRGATLLSLLGDQGVARDDAHAMIDALEGSYNPRRLRAGQEITLTLGQRDGASVVTGFEVTPSAEATIAVSADGQGAFTANRIEHDLETQPVAAGGAITSSLYAAADDAGVPAPVMLGVIRLWSHSVDFQRDLQPGDRFDLLYEHDVHPDGRVARNGNVLYAALTLSGRVLVMHRFEGRDGTVDYYDPDGHSVRRALLRTPIDGARLSSGFGLRMHPVLGYTRMHRGVDFAAPQGTPIFAAGDGTVEVAGVNAGYGLYVRLRHNAHTSTAYGHMSGLAQGMAAGRRVHQGDVIGYVGATGLATGPHLHYEVLVDGTQVDPVGVDRRIGRNLEGRDLVAFRRVVREHEQRYLALRRATDLVAESPEDAPAHR